MQHRSKLQYEVTHASYKAKYPHKSTLLFLNALVDTRNLQNKTKKIKNNYPPILFSFSFSYID